jgi:hypothetical protein
VLHASGGVIVPNPESTVRGLSLNTGRPGALDVGYRLGGLGGALAISRSASLSRRFHVLADGGLLVGYASVPVVNGHAHVPNVGFHGHLGLGLDF